MTCRKLIATFMNTSLAENTLQLFESTGSNAIGFANLKKMENAFVLDRVLNSQRTNRN